MKVSIIIPNRNNVALLGLTMRSLFEDIHNLPYEHEVIIADNSDDEIYEHIKDKLITTKFGYKFLHQNITCLFHNFDVAVKSAKGEYIIRLDSDMLCGKNMIADMVDFMDRHKSIGFGHAPVNFFTQSSAASQHEVSLIPGKGMCRWAGMHKTEKKMTYKGMPWICNRDWYINTLNGYGALSEHYLTPFGDPYIGIKSLLLGYDSWAIPCRSGIHMGRMESSKPFDNFKANSKTGNHNSYMTACVTAYVLTDDVEKWAPVFIRVGKSDGGVEARTIEYYKKNKAEVKRIGANDKKWFAENKKYDFKELIKNQPWNGSKPKTFYERHFPIWKSVSGKRSASCIKQEDWNVLRGLIGKNRVKTILEFGSGLSTILFDKLGINVVSYETDDDFKNKMQAVCSKRVKFELWDNKSVLDINKKFGFALVDGIRPRFMQAENAKKHSDIVVVHDIGVSSKGVPEKALPDWIKKPNNTKRTGVFLRPAKLSNPMVSVIISHRNDFPMLGITIRSVLEDCVDLPEYVEIIVCDNSGANEKENLNYVIAPDLLKTGQVRIVNQEYPCLFTARELAIKAAIGKYIIVLDSHVLAGRHMIRDMVDYMENDAPANIGFAHAPLMYVNQNESAKRHEFKTRKYYDTPSKTGIKGMPWICSKKFWNEIKGYGSLAEHKMSWGGGDVYLALKPWMLGYENWAIPCRPGFHIGPYTKLDRKYYKYRLWGKSGETPMWYGLLAAAYVFGCTEPNNIVTQLRWYHCEVFEKTPEHWNKIQALCYKERELIESRQQMTIEELLTNKPWQGEL